jgi:hypothetical protein
MMADKNYRDNAQPNGIVSGSFDVEVVVLDAGGEGQGADQDCREVIIWPEEGKDVMIGGSVASAAAGPILPDGVTTHPIVLSISNTNLLYFKGTAADKVNLIWRS